MKNITWILKGFDNPPDITTEEWLGDDYYYRKLITNVRDAERFNYHSDYWGFAEEYQEDNVGLMEMLEPYIGQRCYVEDGADYLEGTLEGIMIDKRYNSIAHTCILFSDATDEKGEKMARNNYEYQSFLAGFNAGIDSRHFASRKHAYDEEDEDVQFLYDLAMALSNAGYDVETFEDAGLLTSNLGLVINGNQFSWLGSFAGW